MSRLVATCFVCLLLVSACGPGEDPLQPPPSPSPEDPTGQSKFVFAVKGDWGEASTAQAAVTAQMCATRSQVPFDVVVTTGDNFSNPTGRATETNYWQPEACLISHPAHRWRAVWGNHDIGGDSTGTVLGAVDRNYTWMEGGAQFFMLDSNQASDPAQQAWLADQLNQSRAGVKVAVFHHPPLTAGLHEGNEQVRSQWVPLFEQFGVTLVLSGHSHAYEHSVLNAVNYVVTGGGGAPIYPCVSDPVWLVTCVADHHFLLVEIEGPRVSVTALGISGQVLDRFVIDNS